MGVFFNGQEQGVCIDLGSAKPSQTKFTTPTKSTQVVTADAGFELTQNIVYPIPSAYIIPSGSITLSTNGTFNIAEYSQATVSVAGGGGGGVENQVGNLLVGDAINYVDTQGSVTFVASNTMYGGAQYLSSINLPACSVVYAGAFRTAITIAELSTRGLHGASLPVCTEIKGMAFMGCYNLETVYIPEVKSMGASAFMSCHSLATIDAPQLESVSTSTFYACRGITSVNAPKLKTIGAGAFASCYAMQSITLNHSGITTILSNAFANCSQLSTFSAQNCTTVSDYAFQSAGLTSIDFPALTLVSNLGFGYTKLSRLSLPVCRTIGASGFYSCSLLADVSLPSCSGIYNEAFRNCVSLSRVYAPNVSIVNRGTFMGCTSLTDVSLPSVKTLQNSAFSGCTAMTSISLPACSVLYSGAFNGCTSLSVLVLASTSFVKLSHIGAFTNTPLSKSTYLGYFGSIYVPADMVASYKASTNWVTYSDRITSIENLPTN